MTNPADVSVISMDVPPIAFKDDAVSVPIMLRAVGVKGQHATLTAKLGDEVVARREIAFDADGPRTETIQFTPKADGDRTLTVRVSPLASEAVLQNNERAEPLSVLSRKIRVLLVDRQPRFDFKFLQAALLRDRRVELKCVLLEGDPEIARAEQTAYLPAFPATLKALAEYDLVVLGDVGPSDLPSDAPKSLHDFISQLGGGFACVAGAARGPAAWNATPLANALPVQATNVTAPAVASAASALDRTSAGSASGLLDLSADAADDALLWKGLPGVWWVAPSVRAKPAAQVLVQSRTTDGTSSRPVIVLQQYGLGQSLYIGTDELWRWRRNVGDRYYARLWGQFVQRLALAHLLGQNKRTQIAVDGRTFEPGATVVVHARLFDADIHPIVRPSVRAEATDGNGVSQQITLWQVPDQPGAYRGEFVPSAVGHYSIHMLDTDEPGQATLDVVDPSRELTDIALNESLLQQIVNLSGGAFVREEDLAKLPGMIESKRTPVRATVELQLWSSPGVFLTLLLLMCLEWLLRRWWQLK
ncbi:MAG: hypothetical protein QM770_11490 [Tepidisphaeraceae bacterium]